MFLSKQTNLTLLTALPSAMCLPRSVWSTPSVTPCPPTRAWRPPNHAAPSTTSWATRSSGYRTPSLRSRTSMTPRVRTNLPLNATPPSLRLFPRSPPSRPRPTRTITQWTGSFRSTKTQRLAPCPRMPLACLRAPGARCTAWRPLSEQGGQPLLPLGPRGAHLLEWPTKPNTKHNQDGEGEGSEGLACTEIEDTKHSGEHLGFWPLNVV